MAEEIMVAKKEGHDKLKFKVCDRNVNRWSPKKYEKVLTSRDFNLLAYLFYDLHSMGYPIDKAYLKFKQMMNEPELFFL